MGGMLSKVRIVRFGVILALLLLISSCAFCERVLLVVTDQFDSPALPSVYTGLYAFSDLTSAGLPFDVRTYSRFMTMDMTPYDVIILNGYTTPTPVSQVADRCAALMAAGKKIFINGYYPFRCYDSTGKTYTELYYADRLFGATKAVSGRLTGAATVPATIEKDPAVTAIGISNVDTWGFVLPSPAPAQVYLGARLIGFAGPTGGALRGFTEYEYNLIDYGKLVNFIRHGDGMVVGFANDRYKGVPIAAFHTDCHAPSQLSAVDALVNISNKYSLPVTNTLVLNGITVPTGASKWNGITSPYVAVGSHSRTHPQDWPSLTTTTALASESQLAISDEKALIPKTLNFLSFSGSKNPTDWQLDWLYQNGVLFDGQGQQARKVPKPDGTYWVYQVMPINNGWLKYLSRCLYCPTWPSETMYDDNVSWGNNTPWLDDVTFQYQQNVKYGMYNYSYFHDTFVDPGTTRFTNGVSMSVWIDRSIGYLHDQGVHFMFPHELIPRIQDYIAGQVSYVSNPDGTITITATRPNKLINEVKVGFRGNLTPVAVSGPSVVSQYLASECLYIELPAETTSTVQVQWVALPPTAPTVSTIGTYISRQSQVSWSESRHPLGIAEYQFAVGTTAGGTDAQNWTSVGTAKTASLANANLVNGRKYYVSVRARYDTNAWSDPGVSNLATAELTPPTLPVVVDSGIQQDSTTYLYASWSSNDPESGVAEYQYAIGTAPGSTNIVGWTSTGTATEITNNDLDLTVGQTYYISVKARNGVGLWSSVGSSDGITIIDATNVSIGGAHKVRTENFVILDGNVVTAVYSNEFYMESPDRSSGIRVTTSDPVQLGESVHVEGYVAREQTETLISNATARAATGTTGTVTIKPVFFLNRNLGGADNSIVPGPAGGAGLNNVGLLVKTSGRIMSTGTDYINIDDGSNVDGVAGKVGVKIQLTAPHTFHTGSFVVVTGICSLTADGGNLRRWIRTRTNNDVAVIVP